MCRISGIVTAETSSDRHCAAVKAMCDTMKHGGPDDSGVFVSPDKKVILGNRRLALLDLSDKGHQPMQYGPHLSLTYNGELYNFPELKTELITHGHQFKSHTDTEVILAAYQQWGVQAFERFRGMFAFALYDEKNQCVFLVRDPSGIKPLYYSLAFNSLVFSSEMRAFSASGFPYTNNPQWPVFLMAYGHIPEPITTLTEVRMLPKGCFLRFDCSSYKSDVYSFSHYSFSAQGLKKEEAPQELRKLIAHSVGTHLLADAPVGVFLSGGVDSGILFALAQREKDRDVRAISLIFDEGAYSEKKYQDVLLQQYGRDGEQIMLGFKEFDESLPVILDDMDMPSCDGMNTWFISKHAQIAGCKAALSGIGADELFGGYPSFSRMEMVRRLHQWPGVVRKNITYSLPVKYRRLRYLSLPGITGEYLALRGHFLPDQISKMLGIGESQVWTILEEHQEEPGPGRLRAGNRAGWMEMNMYMKNQLLRDADSMGMKHGVEIRVPFLDASVIRYCLSLHPSDKYSDSSGKKLLSDACHDLIPESIRNRSKMGFSLPYTPWLKKSRFVRDMTAHAGPRFSKAYTDFQEGHIGWSGFYSLLLLRHRLHV